MISIFSHFYNALKNNFLLSIVLTWLIVPFFAYSNLARIAGLFAFLIIVLSKIKKDNIKILALILIYVFYTFITNAFFSSDSYLLRHLQLYIFLFCIYLSYLIKDYSGLRKKEIINVILVFNLISLISSLIILKDDVGASRLLAQSSNEAENLSEKGLGGYSLVYMNVVLFPLFLFLYKKSERNKSKILVAANIILSFVFIIYANYFIAIFIVFFYLSYLAIYKSKGLYRFFMILIIPASIVLVYLNIDYVEKKSYAFVEMTSLKYKHADIFNVIKGKDAKYNTIGGRLERYIRSIKLFIENPLTGTFSFNDIGKHSSILDQFAQFGLFFGLIFTHIIFRTQVSILNYNNLKKKVYVNLYFAGFILVGLLNNFGASMGVAVILFTCLNFYKTANNA